MGLGGMTKGWIAGGVGEVTEQGEQQNDAGGLYSGCIKQAEASGLGCTAEGPP